MQRHFPAIILYLYLLLSIGQRQDISKLSTVPGTIIPARIHQTWKRAPFNDFFRLFNNKRHIKAWRDNNPDMEYYFWTDGDAEVFVKGTDNHLLLEYYPQYYMDYLKLPTAVLKADVFRYMVLNALGGVYSDADTIPLKPVKEWIKPTWLCNNVDFIAGVEFDIPGQYDNIWPQFHENPLQFCQWTMASVPNHEVLNTMITQIFDIIQKSTVEEIEAMDVIGFTGPARWSKVIFSTWEKYGFTVDDFRGFGDEPKCLGNKLILPITCFNPGLTDAWDFGKMGSRSIYDSDALVKHLYAGSWRPADWKSPSRKQQ